MSFSQFIKINKIIENYRADNSKEESNNQTYQESIKSSTIRPKSMRDKKVSTYKFLKKNNKYKIVKNNNYDENLMNIYNSNNYNEIYENIIAILNIFINNNKNYEKLLCKVLKAIYKYIYDFNNNRIKTPNHSTLIVNKSSKKFKKSRTSSNASKKFELLNQDFQRNEYNYLMYINELNKKIFKLENELKIKSAKKKSVKENIKLLFDMESGKYYSYNELKIRKSSFSIIAKKKEYKTNKLLEKSQKKNNLKISLKDIINDCEENLKSDKKFYNNKKYLLSHPRLNFNGYIHNNHGKLSSIVNEKINRVPKEAFGVNLHTKLQPNYKTHLQLTFNTIKFRIEKLRDNKNLETLKF